jgi:hypothetical protein
MAAKCIELSDHYNRNFGTISIIVIVVSEQLNGSLETDQVSGCG